MRRWLLRVAGIVTAFWLLRSWLCRLLRCPQELIVITAPSSGNTVSSPVTVMGRGRAIQHNQLAVEVRDSSNSLIGSATASISAPLGQSGPFTVSVAFSATAAGSPGFVQVFDTSPATVSLTHLASVLVTFA